MDDRTVEAIALLDEPTRRRLYEYVSGRAEPVGRDEAARSLGLSRELVAFHLDRLADAGLLDIEFRRLGDRRGPGAGRPAKLYRRSTATFSASFPARDYERAADRFARSLGRMDPASRASAKTAVSEVAREDGQATGMAVRSEVEGPSVEGRLLDLLAAEGFEPRVDAGDGSIYLRNCPYHDLVRTDSELTCGMNVAWAEGVLGGLGCDSLEASFAPAPDRCCVVFRRVAR